MSCCVRQRFLFIWVLLRLSTIAVSVLFGVVVVVCTIITIVVVLF